MFHLYIRDSDVFYPFVYRNATGIGNDYDNPVYEGKVRMCYL